jgi:hypothetical protein
MVLQVLDVPLFQRVSNVLKASLAQDDYLVRETAPKLAFVLGVLAPRLRRCIESMAEHAETVFQIAPAGGFLCLGRFLKGAWPMPILNLVVPTTDIFACLHDSCAKRPLGRRRGLNASNQLILALAGGCASSSGEGA